MRERQTDRHTNRETVKQSKRRRERRERDREETCLHHSVICMKAPKLICMSIFVNFSLSCTPHLYDFFTILNMLPLQEVNRLSLNYTMSDIWIRKMKTYFRMLDFDEDGVVSRKDFLHMVKAFAEKEKFEKVHKKKARQDFSNVSMRTVVLCAICGTPHTLYTNFPLITCLKQYSAIGSDHMLTVIFAGSRNIGKNS